MLRTLHDGLHDSYMLAPEAVESLQPDALHVIKKCQKSLFNSSASYQKIDFAYVIKTHLHEAHNIISAMLEGDHKTELQIRLQLEHVRLRILCDQRIEGPFAGDIIRELQDVRDAVSVASSPIPEPVSVEIDLLAAHVAEAQGLATFAVELLCSATQRASSAHGASAAAAVAVLLRLAKFLFDGGCEYEGLTLVEVAVYRARSQPKQSPAHLIFTANLLLAQASMQLDATLYQRVRPAASKKASALTAPACVQRLLKARGAERHPAQASLTKDRLATLASANLQLAECMLADAKVVLGSSGEPTETFRTLAEDVCRQRTLALVRRGLADDAARESFKVLNAVRARTGDDSVETAHAWREFATICVLADRLADAEGALTECESLFVACREPIADLNQLRRQLHRLRSLSAKERAKAWDSVVKRERVSRTVQDAANPEADKRGSRATLEASRLMQMLEEEAVFTLNTAPVPNSSGPQPTLAELLGPDLTEHERAHLDDPETALSPARLFTPADDGARNALSARYDAAGPSPLATDILTGLTDPLPAAWQQPQREPARPKSARGQAQASAGSKTPSRDASAAPAQRTRPVSAATHSRPPSSVDGAANETRRGTRQRRLVLPGERPASPAVAPSGSRSVTRRERQQLIKGGAAVCAAALQRAIVRAETDRVAELVSAGALEGLAASQAQSDAESLGALLYLAVVLKRTAMCKKLIDEGAEPCVLVRVINSPQPPSTRALAAGAAASPQRKSIADRVRHSTAEPRETALHAAAALDAVVLLDMIATALPRETAIDTLDSSGRSPLFVAAQSLAGKAVDFLLKSSAAANLVVPETFSTPLHAALRSAIARKSDPQALVCVRFVCLRLLENGANVKATDAELVSPLDLAVTLNDGAVLQLVQAAAAGSAPRDAGGIAAAALADPDPCAVPHETCVERYRDALEQCAERLWGAQSGVARDRFLSECVALSACAQALGAPVLAALGGTPSAAEVQMRMNDLLAEAETGDACVHAVVDWWQLSNAFVEQEMARLRDRERAA